MGMIPAWQKSSTNPQSTGQAMREPQETTVRNATLADADTLAAFNRNIAMETENLALIPAVILSGVKAVFENPARGFYVVAEARGKLVASLLVTREWSDWRDGELWWIQSVYVGPRMAPPGALPTAV